MFKSGIAPNLKPHCLCGHRWGNDLLEASYRPGCVFWEEEEAEERRRLALCLWKDEGFEVEAIGECGTAWGKNALDEELLCSLETGPGVVGSEQLFEEISCLFAWFGCPTVSK